MKIRSVLNISLAPWLVALLLLVISCSRNPVTGKKELMLMSEAQEEAMGAQSDPAIIAAYGLYQDQQLQTFLNDIGQRMAKISHRPNIGYEFKIMDSPVVNAFAAPGGYVYFTRGILAHFNNEAEFAGVLGHEIGHVTARHTAKQYSKQMLAQVGLIAGVIISPEFGQLADVAQQGLGLLFLKFGRDAESQSDQLGVEYSTKIGYDAHQMAGFFRTIGRLQEAAGAEIPTFLSTHPNPADRYEKVNQMADQWQASTGAGQLKVNRNSYLRMIEGIVYGEDPRQGYVEDDRFYHPELKFTFPIPRGWKTNNTPTAFQMGEPNGKAVIVLTLAQQNSLQAAADAFIQDNKLQLINSQKGSVGGLPAISLLAQQTNPQNKQIVNVTATMIEYNGNIYKMYGMSLSSDFGTYRSMMENTMNNFRPLTDRSKLNVTPDRINVKEAQRNTTFGEAIAPYADTDERREELAILNSMELNSPLTAGTLFKVIGK